MVLCIERSAAGTGVARGPLAIVGQQTTAARQPGLREGMADWAAANQVAELSPPSSVNYPSGAQPVLGYGVADSAYPPANMQIRYAGFWIRFCGAFIDGIVVGVGGYIIGRLTGPILMSAASGPNALYGLMGANWTVNTAIGWLYVALMQSSSTQATLGQMATSLRITDLQGRRVTFARATGRYFAAILSGCILWIGYLMMLWSPRKQTLHDQIAGTLVLTK